MKKIFTHNLKILFPSIITLIFVNILWNKINFEYHNPSEIIGYYSIFKYSALNDNIRYIFFVGLPLLSYLISYIYFNKLGFKSFKEAFILKEKEIFNENISLYFLVCFFFLIFIFFVSREFNNNLIDLFHEGQALSGALNLKLNSQLWSGSFIITSLFVDILNANIAWNLFEIKSLSAYRLYIEILNLITLLIILIFVFNLTNGTNLNKNLKTIFFILVCFFIFFQLDNVSLNYRELPIFIFLLFVYKILNLNKLNLIYCLILGILPLLSLLWSLDRGVFIFIVYFPFFVILLINKKIKELFLIILFCISSIVSFYYIIGSLEFNYFINNSLDILSSSDLLNGIIHPTPFSSDYGSSRATKNLLLIIINGILIVNYLFNKKSNLSKNTILFIFIFYLMSLIFYKIGVTRSDGGHIKQGGSLNLILFVYLFCYNSLFFINNNKNFNNLNHNYFKYLNSLLIIIFFLVNIPNNFIKNIYNIKDRVINYINIPDENFLKKDELILINELRLLTVNEKCFQVFSYETAISYYLNKTTCTKFYHIMNMGSKKNQLIFIEELKKNKPKFVLSGGTYQNIGNMKGRNETELSPKDRFPYIDNFISENYKIYKEIDKWKILVKN
tara:strand:+ start:98 stop:1945 length:1848 start_codon:yes stop_codon:yes gene_type:complete